MTVYRPRQEVLCDYEGFVEKFKPKKTTDDCMTPEAVYDAVLGWAVAEYGLEGREVVRPFWPGGDYGGFDYPDGCVVIDNPPFSILSRIVDDLNAWGVDYLLFAPAMTCLGLRAPCHIVVREEVVYENGAKVPTAFVTDLEQCIARTAPVLDAALKAANSGNRPKKELPRSRLPRSRLPRSRLPRSRLPRSRCRRGSAR